MKTQQLPLLVGSTVIGAILMIGGTFLYGHGRPETSLVLIVVDSLRADAFSQSAGAARTPNIDALAGDGIAFPRAFSHSPTGQAAHTALFASKLASTAGVTGDGQPIPLETTMLAEWMRVRGYRTRAAVSLENMRPSHPRHGLDRGFEVYETYPEPDVSALEMNERLLPMLGRVAPEAPFFLFAHYGDPHAPYEAHEQENRTAEVLVDDQHLVKLSTSDSEQYHTEMMLEPGVHKIGIRSLDAMRLRELFIAAPSYDLDYTFSEGGFDQASKRITLRVENKEKQPLRCKLRIWVHDEPTPEEIHRRYKLEVEAVDRAVGDLVARLRREGLYDHSLIVLTADHGEALGEHGEFGHGKNLFDEVLRVPLIIKPPFGDASSFELEEASKRLARHIDVAPTILEILDLPPMPDMQGSSLTEIALNVLEAETYPPAAQDSLFAMRDDRHKLIYDPLLEKFEMYNLAQDPSELDDVYSWQGHLLSRWQQSLMARARLTGVAELTLPESGEVALAEQDGSPESP